MSINDLFARRPGELVKPPRGTARLEAEAKRAEIEEDELRNKFAAKRRDHSICRWPERHKCRGIIEGVHVFVDKGMGGDHGLLSGTWNLMGLCSWIHRTGPHTIHNNDLLVRPLTERGADDICEFLRRAGDTYVIVGVERSIGLVIRD